MSIFACDLQMNNYCKTISNLGKQKLSFGLYSWCSLKMNLNCSSGEKKYSQVLIFINISGVKISMIISTCVYLYICTHIWAISRKGA